MWTRRENAEWQRGQHNASRWEKHFHQGELSSKLRKSSMGSKGTQLPERMSCWNKSYTPFPEDCIPGNLWAWLWGDLGWSRTQGDCGIGQETGTKQTDSGFPEGERHRVWEQILETVNNQAWCRYLAKFQSGTIKQVACWHCKTTCPIGRI